MKLIKALLTLALVAAASSAYSAPQAVQLLTHNSRSGGGTLSTLVWRGGCSGLGAGSGCYNFTNAYTSANIDPTGSTASWTWDNDTGVLSMTGLFITTSFVGSNPNGTPILSDRVVDLTITTAGAAPPTAASGVTSYRCIEGTFLAGVGSNGCGAYSLGFDATNQSSRDYMGDPADPALPYIGAASGTDPYCVRRTLLGDDVSTGNARGARNGTAYVGGNSEACEATAGAFELWQVVSNSGGFLVIGNGIPIASPNTTYLTFAVPVPAAVWLFGSALGLLGWVRRRAMA